MSSTESMINAQTKPTYDELLAALQALDAERGHTMHKPAGGRAYRAVVIPRDVFDSNVTALVERATTSKASGGPSPGILSLALAQLRGDSTLPALPAPALGAPIECARRPNFDHSCRLNFDQGWKPVSVEAGCG